MATEEKSRDAFEPKKRYAAVGMQLGRVLLDDDFNEAERIRLEQERRVNIDVIGPVGSPDDGFKLQNGPGTASGVDFEIAAGTLYLGGLRLWNPVTVKFSLQDDWLQQSPSDRPSLTPDRTDLVYIEAWQQPVTAAEDGELFEVALGGPDTSDRLRTMWRVHIASEVTGTDCPDAWASVVSDWATLGLGSVDATGERVVDTKLKVTYTAGVVGDLCTPAISAGYLGAENQTIRVQLRERGLLTWGFDNAAPVYRATIKTGDRRTITLLTDPRDEVHWPTAGQVVEILPWSTVLSNNEKLAEDSGHLGRVETSYTPTGPNAHQFVLALADAVPLGFGEAWKTRSDMASLGTEYVFVRVWNRGDDVTSPLAIPYVVGTPVDLGTTGIRVTITGTSFVGGDHWLIAARPKTPDQVVPWDLEDGRRIHGTRRFFAPLGLIRWKADGTFDLLHDCRPFFPPLTRLRGCCTYTVGDETSSFGQFTTIQAAVNALPADGGKVCVLPGKYTEIVVLFNKTNVTIEGCGTRSKIAAPEGAPWTVLVIGGKNIAIKDLEVDCGDSLGIVLLHWTRTGKTPGAVGEVAWISGAESLSGVRIEGVTVSCRGRAGILAVGCTDLCIRECEVLVDVLASPIIGRSDLGLWPAIALFACGFVTIEGNRVIAKHESTALPGAVTSSGQITYTRTAMGGIQLGGGCIRVEVRRNLIVNGNGDGITLGSWAWVPDRTQPFDKMSAVWDWWATFTLTVNAEGCIEIVWDPPPGGNGNPNETTWTAVSMGDLADIRIIDNEILQMGKSGIGVARFFDLGGKDEIIAVHGLDIHDNRIVACVKLPIPELPSRMLDVAAQGAITLAEVRGLSLQRNQVRENGRRHTDPVCGVFALISVGAVIENNAIVDNAPFVATQEPIRPGWRGGVVLTQALAPATQLFSPELNGVLRRQSGEPTARISDNEIVVPEGRTIVIIGYGPMSIADNHLTTRGPALADVSLILNGGGNPPQTLNRLLDLLGGIAVTVFNVGESNELQYLQLRTFNNLGGMDLEPGPGIDARPPTAASGNVTFVDNQVNIDVLRPPNSALLSGVMLISTDDIEAAGNQIELDRFADLMLLTLATLAMTARIENNRVKDSIGDGKTEVLLTGLSIYSIGLLLNMTIGNQTTRCINALGLRATSAPNQVMMELFQPDFCANQRARALGVSRFKLLGASPSRSVDTAAGARADPTEQAMTATFDLADGAQRLYARDAVRYQTARVAANTRELQRVRTVASKNAAAIAEVEARVAEASDSRDTANLGAARASVEPVEVSPDIAIVHGLVLDKAAHTRAGLAVRAVDRAGRPVAATKTDDNGYFRLDLAPDTSQPPAGGGTETRIITDRYAHADADTIRDSAPAPATGAAQHPAGTTGAGGATTGAGGAATGGGRTAPIVLEVADGERVVFRDKQPLTASVGKHRYREIRIE